MSGPSKRVTVKITDGPQTIPFKVVAGDLGTSGIFCGELWIVPEGQDPVADERNPFEPHPSRSHLPFTHRFVRSPTPDGAPTVFEWNIIIPQTHRSGAWDVYLWRVMDAVRNRSHNVVPTKLGAIEIQGGSDGGDSRFAPGATFDQAQFDPPTHFDRFVDPDQDEPDWICRGVWDPATGLPAGVTCAFEMNGGVPLFRGSGCLRLIDHAGPPDAVDLRAGNSRAVPFDFTLADPPDEGDLRVYLTRPGEEEQIVAQVLETTLAAVRQGAGARYAAEFVVPRTLPAGFYTLRVEIDANPGQPLAEKAVFGSTGKASSVSPLLKPYILQVLND